MPSPFPGPDPYLEQPALWPAVHQRLITYLADELNGLLPPRYVANIGERVCVADPSQSVYPDALVLERRPTTSLQSSVAAGAAVADEPLVIVEPAAREVFVEVILPAEDGRVVTVIEVLSPSNKTGARDDYLAKQRALLAGSVHLLEVDLLRGGRHTAAVSLESLRRHGPHDGLVCLHRGGGGRFEVWPLSLRERLPRVRVPLAGDDPDVIVDLQPLYDRCYDSGGFARRIDYHAEAPVPLRPDDAEWSAELLRSRGLRGRA